MSGSTAVSPVRFVHPVSLAASENELKSQFAKCSVLEDCSIKEIG